MAFDRVKYERERSLRRKAQKRVPLEGFPRKEPFTLLTEVKEYLSGDRLVCLLCGKSYQSLQVHIPIVHNTSLDEYKLRYAIPWTYGLLGKDLKETYREAYIRRLEEDENMRVQVEASRLKKGHASFPRRKHQPTTLASNSIRIILQNKGISHEQD